MDPFNAMDMTKLDQAAAATRQKSCNACVRGKRRCDKKMPRCTRCAAKGLDCLYKKMPSESSSPSTTNDSAYVSVSHSVPASHLTMGGGNESMSDVPDFDMGFDMESLGTETSPESLQPDVGLQIDPAMEFNMADLMAGSSDFWNTHYGDAGKMDLPVVPGPPARRQIRDVAHLPSTECVPLDPLQVHDPRSPIGYIADYLSTMHQPFARTRALPFIHPQLWTGSSRMPSTILSAFTAATAYTGRTPETRAWVLRILADAAKDVHREGERPGLTVPQKLARVQALVLLATMRVFDGDVGARAAVEREMGILTEWVYDLVKVREDLEGGVDPSVNMSKERPPKSWDSWILQESVRRTVIMAYSFICVFCTLRSEEPPCDLQEDHNCFTASKPLWEAASSFEFYRAWRERHQYCIVDIRLQEFWMYARPDDMDEFTKLLLTVQAGPDAVDHFLMGETSIPMTALRTDL